MKYGIVVNPVAGRFSRRKKESIISEVVGILGPQTLIDGWETTSATELCACAKHLAANVDVLVVAGGDGTLSDIVNCVTPETVLSYIPLGSGNAWRQTLGLPTPRWKIARRISAGREHPIDLVLCDGHRKALFASVGIEGHVLHERAKCLEKGVAGFSAYSMATAKSLFWGYKRSDATVTIDGIAFEVPKAMSVMITKTPYYGYGFKIVPQASLDDGYLHVLCVSTGLAGALYGIITSFLGGNRVGEHRKGKAVSIVTQDTAYLQIDGTLEREGTDFRFELLPSAVRMRY